MLQLTVVPRTFPAWLLLSLLAAPAAAQPADALRWRAPPGECPDAAALWERVQRHGGSGAALQASGHRLDIEVQRSAGHWRAEVQLRDEAGTLQGQRVLTASAGCEALVEQVVVVVGLLTTPLLQPPASPETAQASDDERAAPPQPQSQPTKAQGRWVLSVRALAAGGMQPGVALGGGAAIRWWSPRRVGLAAGGHWLAARDVRSAGRDVGQLGVAFAFGELCVEALRGSGWAISPCAQAQVGRVRSLPASGQDQPRSSLPLVNALAGLRYGQRLGAGVVLAAWLQTGSPLIRHAFTLEQDAREQRVFRTRSWVAEGGISLGWQIP